MTKKTTVSRCRRIHRDENTRAKIQAAQLINRLTNHVLGKLRKPMEASQVTAALGLLKKALPDLSATNIQGDIFNHHYVVSAQPMSDEEWEREYADGFDPTNDPSENTH